MVLLKAKEKVSKNLAEKELDIRTISQPPSCFPLPKWLWEVKKENPGHVLMEEMVITSGQCFQLGPF